MNPEIEILKGEIEQLKRTQKRQRALHMVLFCAALLTFCASRAVTQNSAAPQNLAVRSLRVVGSDGKVRVLISADKEVNADGGSIAILDNAEKPRVGIMATKGGGNVSILRGDAEPMAILGYDADGGLVTLRAGKGKGSANFAALEDGVGLNMTANDGKTQVNIAAAANASGLVVTGTNKKEHFVAGADNSGGIVELYDFGGKLKKKIP